MKLNELKNDKNPRQNRKRVGRGIGCGKGKTCGRGVKGQTSRSGVSINGFEGGQTPIYRRIPKKGFTNIFRTSYETINTGELQRYVDSKRIDSKKTVTKEALVEAGLLKNASVLLKVLAKGAIKSALKIEADAASAGAIESVKKAGGEITILASDIKEVA